MIILEDFLPYYRLWPTENRAVPTGVREMNEEAHVLWERGAVEAEPTGKSYMVTTFLR